MVLGLIGGIAAILGAAEASNIRHGFMTNSERKQFDQENARNGIDYRAIERIAARCHVKTSKYGVLPMDGYYKCLSYVRQYANSPQDVDRFIKMWKVVVKRQLREEPDRVREGKLAQKYPLAVRSVTEDLPTIDRNNLLTFEIRHWLNITPQLHEQRMKNIAENTVIKEILAQPPVLRWGSTWENERIEYWTIFGQPNEEVDFITKQHFKGLYQKCCAYCGYDPEL